MRQLSFITRSRFLLCGGSFHSSSGFRDLRTAEHIVRIFGYAPKGGQSSKYLCHETLHQLFCFTDECIFLLFQHHHSHLLLLVHSQVAFCDCSRSNTDFTKLENILSSSKRCFSDYVLYREKVEVNS